MLNLADVPFTKWLKLMLPIYLILFGIALISIVVAVQIGLQ
jgi:uncharacterized ion transporter superfamily protein YfcC